MALHTAFTGRTEEQFQAWCFLYFHNNYIEHRGRLFAVDNNVSQLLSPSMRAREGNRKKQMGIVAGVSDMILVLPNMVFFIELKYGAVQSIEQKAFEKLVTESGHYYLIIKNPQEWMSLLNDLLNGL